MPPAQKTPEPEPDVTAAEKARRKEAARIRRERYREARLAGLTDFAARVFTDSDIETGELRRLVKGGCPPHLIPQILF